MKHLLTPFKIVTVISSLFFCSNALAIPAVDAQVINYSVEPRSGANFNRIEQLSIIIFADKLSKEYRSPYTLTYSIVDKAGKVIEGSQDKILFTQCNDMMLQVKIVGSCAEFNNVATVRLKTRQTRKPPSTKGYSKEGRFWTQDDEAGKFPRFEEMEYKLVSYTITDKNGKLVK